MATVLPGVRWWGSTTTSRPQLGVSAAIGAQAELSVPDRVGVARLPGDETGETLPSSLDEVEPCVLAERRVRVGFGCRSKQFGDCRPVFVVEVAFDLDVGHRPEATAADPCPPRSAAAALPRS